MHNLESEYILSRIKEPKLLSDSGENQVYMVLDTTTNRPYIQRVFLKDANMDIYQQMQSLAPKNIPKIHHIIEGEAHNYVIEEYISGTRLDELVGNRGKFDAEQVVTWVLSLCDTLRQLHNANPPIIHRDIKPSNIIITDEGMPKLIDFNISRNYKSDGNTDTKALGTEYYAAPEQFGFAQTDNRTDIYAIGKLMITLSTGKQQKPEDGLATCGSLKTVIEKCCAIDPTRRYQDVAELRKALAQTRGNRFKWITGIVAVCAVLAVCYCGYRYFGKPAFDTPVYSTQESASAQDAKDEFAQRESTPEQPAMPQTELPSEPEPEAEPEPSTETPPENETALTEQVLIDEKETDNPENEPEVNHTSDTFENKEPELILEDGTKHPITSSTGRGLISIMPQILGFNDGTSASDVDVYINGELAGRSSERYFETVLPDGEYEISCRENGYQNYDFKVKIDNSIYRFNNPNVRGTDIKIHYLYPYVVKNPDYIEYKVATVPEGADVFIGDEYFGKSPTNVRTMDPMTYLRIYKEGYTPIEYRIYREVDTMADETGKLTIELTEN